MSNKTYLIINTACGIIEIACAVKLICFVLEQINRQTFELEQIAESLEHISGELEAIQRCIIDKRFVGIFKKVANEYLQEGCK